VDATVETKLGETYKVNGYPTLKWFDSPDDTSETVSGDDNIPRSKDGIVGLAKERAESDWERPAPTPTPTAEPFGVEEGVLNLGYDDFNTVRKEKEGMLVMFYAPWCGHCKAMKPAFAEAAAEAPKVSKMSFAAVDCTVDQKICAKYGVKGYPTLYYVGPKSKKKYEEGRDKDALLAFAEKEMPLVEAEEVSLDEPDSLALKSDAALTKLRGKGPVMLLLCSGECDQATKVLEQAKEESESEGDSTVRFGKVDCAANPSMQACESVEETSMKLFLGKDDDGIDYTGKMKHFALLTFMDMHLDGAGGHDEL